MLLDLGFWVDWLRASIRLSGPLALTAIGGTYSERSGIFNIGMEGMMLSGAFFAVVTSHYTGNPLLATLAGAMAGAILGGFLGVLTISRRADQIIAGIMINLLALGLTNFLFRELLGAAGRQRVPGFPALRVPLLADIPVLGPILFRQDLSVYVAYAIPVVATWVLFRTSWGLEVQAVGEHPFAAHSAGVSVKRVRYLSVIFSGFMAGLGGVALALGGARFFTHGMTAGRGFIAIGAIVLGRWNPARVALACLLFGAADALQLRAQTFDFPVPHEFFAMLPYLLTVAALVGLVGRTRAPSQLGLPYAPEDQQ